MLNSRLTLILTIATSLALIGAIPISIIMKYHGRNFSYVDSTVFRRQDLKPFKFISVKNLNNFNIVTSDSLRIEVAESIFHSTRITNFGDTLQIINDDINAKDTSRIILYLPKGGAVRADHSTLSLKGAFQREPLPDYTVYLSASNLSIPKYDYYLFINKLTVSSNDSSRLTIQGNNKITDLFLSNVLMAKIASGTVWRYQTKFMEKKAVGLNFDGDNFRIESKE